MSARDRLREFLQANVGRVVTNEELAAVGRVTSWPRRLRELRDEEGMQILSHHDREELKPGQYVLISLDRVPRVERRIDPRVRAEVLQRDGSTCQMCGAAATEPDPVDPRRRVRLHVDHIDPNAAATPDNLRVLCSACNEGRSNIHVPRSTVNLLTVVRRSSREDQRAVYAWLRDKFGPS